MHAKHVLFARLVHSHRVPTHLRNAWGQTPLLMAASQVPVSARRRGHAPPSRPPRAEHARALVCQGSVEAFATAFECSGNTLWEFAQLRCIEFPLLEIDSQLEGHSGQMSVLRTLVRQGRLEHLELLQVESPIPSLTVTSPH